MKMSKLFVQTLREFPSDAEVVSHKMLVRAGYIRKLTSGVYNYLPLMWRVLKKVENIVVSDNKNVATPVKSTRTENKIANEIKDIDAYLKEIDDAIAAENAILEETQKELAKKAKFRNKK